jgi:hypothetical protein
VLIGLTVGVAAATWAFSGMLSMDPFPSLRPRGGAGAVRDEAIIEALRAPANLALYGAKEPRAALIELGVAVKELELTTAAGQSVYVATLRGGGTRIVPLDGLPRAELDRRRIIDLVEKAAAPVGMADVRVIDQYDLYYLDRRRERPLPVILARLTDPDHTRYYIDPKTGLIVGTYNSRNWVSRWLYHGLHSLDFPWLYNYRPAWDVVVLAFMLSGTALGATSAVLAWRVLGRKLKHAARTDTRPARL